MVATEFHWKLSKIENFIKSQMSVTGITESNGFGLLRFDQDKKKLMSHSEALGYREQCLKFRVPRGVEHLLEQPRIESFHSMLDASIILGQLLDVRISEGDQFLLYMRNLPNKVQSFFQLHQNAIRVQQILTGVQDYYTRPRVQRDRAWSALGAPDVVT